ncbi:MAG: RtcB family protein [Candidatus Kapaibacterium sp.]
MITSAQLIEMNWPKGKVFGEAIAVAQEMAATGATDEQILSALKAVRTDPESYKGEGNLFQEIAKTFIGLNARDDLPQIREVPMEAPIWGEHLIDQGAVDQLRNAMRLPVTVAGALMPDAHIGYGIPIGGVVALENAVAPYMVGVDIACRMMMSIYPKPMREDFEKINTYDLVKRAMREETRFGIGAQFGKYDLREHEVMDDPDWNQTKLLIHLKQKGAVQLGTSGTGNHFVDAGILNVGEEGAAELGIEAGEYLAIMSHSGSRGVGAKICDYYSGLAQKITTLPKELRHLAWLPMDTEEGEEYWISMNLAGKFASANHHTIHQAIAKRIGERPVAQVENHHNFAWLEEHNGKEVYVHRKGATPAGEGVLGIIPGSMGHDSFIVRGKGSKLSLDSASHGAGRVMSRKQAKQTLPKKERDAWLAERQIDLMGGGMDEAPQVYKDIEEVLAVQTDLVEPVARFTPRIVLMANDGKSED